MEILIKTGLDLEEQDKNGETPLHISSSVGNIKLIQWILKQGISVNLKDKIGRTALHNAALYGHLRLVYFLLKIGADPKIKDRNLENPIDSCNFGHDQFKSIFSTYSINVYDKIFELLKKEMEKI
ncbi:ankyrin repeat-containing protein [Anaeramoeba ignava]|uniref:Ankyrin repeat-containing protein n=1 Tax=Anaeramoeba ignava TaxID=1746090 RepID=A0A9Q0REU4_ANAIG|nr:ankyrin repeat-containing protein [Anaeramoeba ignava]